jgi:dienelactone hydrolase
MLWLCDAEGLRRDSFYSGENIFIAGNGLFPVGQVYLTLTTTGQTENSTPLARLTTDRHGSLPPTLLIPYLGLFDKEHSESSLETALKAHREQNYTILAMVHGQAKRGKRFSIPFRQLPISKAPRLFSSDAKGRLQTGVTAGDAEISVTLVHFPAGCVRIYVVPRQFGWRTGDTLRPARLRDGTMASVTIQHDGAPFHRVSLAPSAQLTPGSYQFIARAFPPGWYQADADSLLAGDIVSDHQFASLVIRRPINIIFDYDNGVVLTPEIAGRPLPHPPYFNFINNFPLGTDVYAALDPDHLPQGLVSQRAAIYVIQHKSAAAWGVDNSLNDISGPGMTPAVKIVPIVPGCVNWNRTLVWPNPQTPGQYDIAIDFGNNAPLAQNFAADGHLDAPLDMIDGYVRVGFYVTVDPSLPGPYAGSIGQHDYALPAIQVPSTDAGPTPTDWLPLTATIRYPAQSSGVDATFATGSFPLIVIMHGNSGEDTSYLGYNYLLDHLASQGFIAMSIYAPVGVMIETRARDILAHLGIMAQLNTTPGLFQGHIDFTRVGIMGHSRGGEAVVRAARINTAEALGWNIKAGISIAPTDYNHYGDPGVPLLVIYGSNDGDVSGSWPNRTCFNIYDEAGRPRSFVFVYGATHDRFNTVWTAVESQVEFHLDITPSDIPQLISPTDHQNVAKGYAAAFMQAHLQGHDEQLAYFSDGLKPSLVSGITIHTNHQVPGATMLDNYEQLDPNQNTQGGSVTTNALTELLEDSLRTLDIHSPHITRGGEVAWQSTAGIYLSHIPAITKDVSAYNTLSFRVTQKYASPQNPAGQAQDFYVRLTDSGNHSRAIRVSVFTDIPYPYVRGDTDLIKSALKTIRIPLASYWISNYGAQDVDLHNLTAVSFEFSADATGEIEIDDLEFTP